MITAAQAPAMPPSPATPGRGPRLIDLTLHVWRQAGPGDRGGMVTIDAPGISTEMSLLEMLDVVNERLTLAGDEPIAFEHDCREGICGSCGMMVNGIAHGPQRATTVCRLHVRSFHDGRELWIEPWRAEPFPVIRDLGVDRGAFERIIQAGGYLSAPAGRLLPQGQAERGARVLSMVAAHGSLGFGSCTNIGECSAAGGLPQTDPPRGDRPLERRPAASRPAPPGQAASGPVPSGRSLRRLAGSGSAVASGSGGRFGVPGCATASRRW